MNKEHKYTYHIRYNCIEIVCIVSVPEMVLSDLNCMKF